MNRFPYPDDLDNPIELMSFIVRGEVRYSNYLFPVFTYISSDSPTTGRRRNYLESGYERLYPIEVCVSRSRNG